MRQLDRLVAAKVAAGDHESRPGKALGQLPPRLPKIGSEGSAAGVFGSLAWPDQLQEKPPGVISVGFWEALVDFFGAEGFLTHFPVQDPNLAHVLQTLLDYDPDRYVDLVRLDPCCKAAPTH